MADVDGDTVATRNGTINVDELEGGRGAGKDNYPPKTAFISLIMLALAASTP